MRLASSKQQQQQCAHVPYLRWTFTLAVATTIAVAAENVTCTRLGTAATIAWLVLAALGSCLDRQASQEQQTEDSRDAHSGGLDRGADWTMIRDRRSQERTVNDAVCVCWHAIV
jgi:hypothetical protein